MGEKIVTFEGHRARITGCAFREGGGPFVATRSEDRSFRVWDLEQRCCAAESSVLCAPALTCLAFAEDGRAAVAAADGRAWVWRTRDGGCREDVAADLGSSKRSSEEAKDDDAVHPLALGFDGATLHVAASSMTPPSTSCRGRSRRRAASTPPRPRASPARGAVEPSPSRRRSPRAPRRRSVKRGSGPLSFFATRAVPDASPLRKDLAPRKAEKKVLAAYDNQKKAPRQKKGVS